MDQLAEIWFHFSTFSGSMDKKMRRKRSSKRRLSKAGSGLPMREETDDLSRSLLPPALVKGRGAKTQKKKSGQKVQWRDMDGNQLVEVLEFEPSDTSDADDEELDYCPCTIM
ncbi:hypothetical protein Sjap_006099 [Stephania japonica]|uniref:Uncharacterized protein n=1 Tax=Stephania japonica TaxID=461633 RepID=A0AAP0K5E4_9MAGN